MKMVMISYNSAVDSDLMELFNKYGIEGFTRWRQVQGRGRASGSHFGDEIWPGENSVIFTALEDKKTDELFKGIKELRLKLGRAGVKAFVWNLTEIS